MKRSSPLARLACSVLFATLWLSGCGGDDPAADEAEEPTATVPVDDRGFPIEWPLAQPPGSVIDCPRGEVSQLSLTFSVVLCLPDDPDPLTVAEQYLDQLRVDGFVEREPGIFAVDQQTFLDGNGIEVYFQLIGDEATIVLVKSS